MNCQEFENILHSLVSGRLPDRVRQTKALAHVQSCSFCSTRLQNEQLLAAGLNALAAETGEKQAPSRIENALLEAFRVHKSSLISSNGLKATIQNDKGISVSLFSTPRTGRPHSRGWLIGTAASALLLAAVGFIQWRVRHIQPAITQIPKVSVSRDSTRSPIVHEVPDASLTIATQPTPVPKVEKGRHGGKAQNFNLRKYTKADLGSTSEEVVGRREIDSKFLPLMAASPLEPTESGHLIRMNLPRSTMGRFGFPISLERSEEPIKADVLIGEDGVARAIRFVYMAEKVSSSAR